MKLLITRGFCLGHGIDVFPGDTVNIDDQKAAALIIGGKAVAAPEDAEPDADAEEVKQPVRKGARHARD